ncbi:MAG: hypothetical protein JWR21_4367 [Herminiimonas sp.]|nr:hypothetical protein [Herminiimonas sp.]
MKIYKGPSTKGFTDDAHEKVDEKNLSSDEVPWVGTRRVQVNMTKDHWERRSVANVVFDEGDVMSLHKTLINGWQQRAQTADTLAKEVLVLQEALRHVHLVASLAGITSHENPYAEIIDIVDSALHKE